MNSDKEIAVYDSTISARTYLSYISEQAGGFACIGRDGKLYIRTIGESIAELPIKYFQKYTWGEKFKITRVKYEDGIQTFEAGDETNNTVYISQDNMYIVDQEQIDNIYNQLNDLEVYSFEGDSIIDPALDIGDLLLIDGKYVIYQGSSQYCGKWKANISSKIQCKSKEETTTRTVSEKTAIRRVQSQIDQIEGEITQLVEEQTETNEKLAEQQIAVDGIQSTVSQTQTIVGNNYNELKTKFDDYAPKSDVVSLQTSVEKIQTDTYTKTEINTKLTDGSVTKVLTTAGIFDEDGLTIEKTNAKTKGNFNEKGITVTDATSGSDEELLFAGYDEDLGETIVRSKNMTVEKYFVISDTARQEKYENPTLGGKGIGVFIL